MLDAIRNSQRGRRLLRRVLAVPDHTPPITPVEAHGGVLIKREDAWSRRGASGANARAMFTAADRAAGMVTAGSRISPQLERAALIAHALGIPARLHTGFGRPTDEILLAEAAGAEVVRHKPARLSVIRARYRADAATRAPRGWAAIPFGMEHAAYVEQAAHLPVDGFARIVVPVGSGMTLAAIFRGLGGAGRRAPILGVRVGTDPTRLLDRYAPGWRTGVTLTESATTYEQAAADLLGDLALDPYSEAKCLPFLRDSDLLWAVGLRTSALHLPALPQPRALHRPARRPVQHGLGRLHRHLSAHHRRVRTVPR